LRVIAATMRPAAGRVLVPPGEAGVKDGEHEPAARSEDASNSGDRTIEIIDVGQTMIAGDTVEGLAGERLCGGDVDVQIPDAERLLDFGCTCHVQQNIGDVDADDSGATACEFPSDPAMTTGEVQDARPANASQEVEQRDSRRLAAQLRADHIQVEVADEVVAGRENVHSQAAPR